MNKTLGEKLKRCSVVSYINSAHFTRKMTIGLELVGVHAELIVELASKYKIMGFPVDASYTDVLFEEFKYIPVELLSLEGPNDKELKCSLFPGHPCSFSSNEMKYGG